MVEEEVIFIGMAAAPIITAMVQVIKPFVKDPRLYPIIAAVLGVGWNVGFTIGTDDFSRATIFLGLMVGLSAAGIYSAGSAVKNTLNGRGNSDGS
ncbi:hypothetical protein LCGC14_1102170 [marine sediment metagenome]|uniref:Holin n=1 Tax=marine sediment metagenome TaxID=412755 RepID=A0A0F9QFC9_9ZZZZ